MRHMHAHQLLAQLNMFLSHATHVDMLTSVKCPGTHFFPSFLPKFPPFLSSPSSSLSLSLSLLSLSLLSLSLLSLSLLSLSPLLPFTRVPSPPRSPSSPSSPSFPTSPLHKALLQRRCAAAQSAPNSEFGGCIVPNSNTKPKVCCLHVVQNGSVWFALYEHSLAEYLETHTAFAEVQLGNSGE